jgi:hypothetical protein
VTVNVAAVPLTTLVLLAVSVMASMGTGFNDVNFVVVLLLKTGSVASGVLTRSVAVTESPLLGVFTETTAVELLPVASGNMDVKVAALVFLVPLDTDVTQPDDTEENSRTAGDQVIVNCWLGRLDGP